jgi:hypothetical protein
MTPLYIAYTPATGWTLITPDSYAAPLAPGECRVRRANMAGGAQIHVRTVADAAQPDWTGEPQIGRRAAQWLVESGYARKQHGALVIDDRKVSADTVNFPVEMMPELMPAPTRRTPMTAGNTKGMDILDIAPDLHLTALDLIGKSVAFLGITGSGKTNSIARTLEQLKPFVEFAAIDIAGEYAGLREIGAVTFGAAVSPSVDVAVRPEQGGRIADLCMKERKSVILDLSRFDPDDDDAEAMTLVETFLRRVWFIASTRDEADRKPLVIVVEEAHIFIPQAGKSPVRGILRRIATMGRKLGLSLFISSQRPAAVDKGVLTQCAISFLHNVTADVDRARYADIVPAPLLPGQNVKNVAFDLERGEALVLRGKSLVRTHIHVRRTRHGGHTPGIGDAALPEGAAPDTAALDALRELFAAGEPDAQTDDAAALRARIAELEAIMKAKDERIAELETQQMPRGDSTFRREWAESKARPSVSFSVVTPPAARAIVPTLVTTEDGTPFNADDRREQRSYPLEASIARRERDTTARLIRKQERDFADLLDSVRRWLGFSKRGNWQRDFLTLLQRHGTVSRAQAVSWLRISAATFTSNPPTPLVKAGLITVARNRGNYSYTWNAPQRLALAFPDLDARELEQKLLA